MKLSKIIGGTLKVLGYLMGITGALMILGSIGASETFRIGLLQFFIQEILAFAVFFFAFIVYNIGKTISYKNY